MKILNTTSPLISCYPHHANLCAGIMTNDFDFMDIAANYIVTIYNCDINRLDFNFGIHITNYIKNYPHVDTCCYNRNVVKNAWNSYSSFAKTMIDNDCYVHFLIDTCYVSAYKEWYGKYHELHNITIYGYDDTHFYVADSFVDGKYSFSKIPQHEIDDAELSPDAHDWLDGVHCWELKEGMYLRMWLSPNEVRKNIRMYLDSVRVPAIVHYETRYRNRYDYHYCFGLDIYGQLIKYVRDNSWMDFRIPYVMIEQKRVLQYICQVLESQYRLIDFETNLNNMKILERNNSIIMNLFLKYNMTGNIRIKESIINAINKAYEAEIELLEKLYNDIQLKSTFNKIPNITCKEKIEILIDTETQGNWKGKYGSKGYYIIGDKINLPDGVTIHTNNCRYVSLLRNKADKRGLYRSQNDKRLASYYLHSREFNIVIDLKEETKITLYLLDYDKLDRKEKIIIQKKQTGEVIAEQKFTDIENGVYFAFTVDEDIVISGRCLNGPDATISALFFD